MFSKIRCPGPRKKLTIRIIRGKRRLNMNSEQSDVDYRFTLIINRTSERSKNLASDSECESLNYA